MNFTPGQPVTYIIGKREHAAFVVCASKRGRQLWIEVRGQRRRVYPSSLKAREDVRV